MKPDRNRRAILLPFAVAVCVAGALPAVAQQTPAPPAADAPAPVVVTPPADQPASPALPVGALPLPPAPQSAILTPTAAMTTASGPMLPIETGLTMPPREADEEELPFTKLLPEVIRKILVPEKRFEYDPKGEPDPMIIPWIRTEILSTEHITQAKDYIQEAGTLTDLDGKRKLYLMALDELERVIKMDPTSKYGHEALALKEQAQQLLEGLAGTTSVASAAPLPKPPEWIVLNTKAVVFDESPKHDHTALVGDSMLRIGDTVPKYPEVKVVEIARDAVTYEFQYDGDKAMRFAVNVEVEVRSE